MKHKHGLTFKGLIIKAIQRGGLTVGLSRGHFLKVKEFKSGYMVGGFSGEYKIAVNDIEDMRAIDLYNILDKLYRQAPAVGGLYLGLWIDNGLIYMEISKRIASKKQALKEAKERKQLAIYDNKNNESIYIK